MANVDMQARVVIDEAEDDSIIRVVPPKRPWLRGGGAVAAVALCVTVFAGCTNSKFLVGAFYDRADDKALDAAEEWVDFLPGQRAELAAYIGTFHTWHRRVELPRYAALMRKVTSGLSTWDQATPADFSRWIEAARTRAEAVRACHPARYGTPLVRTLSDQQIDRIERTWREKRAENRARRPDETDAQRIARRVKGIDTWIGRLGVELEPDQLALLEQAFTQQIDLSSEYRELSDAWNEKLFELVRDRASPDHDASMDAHIEAWFGMVEKAHPEAWESNRRLWRDTAVAFEKTLSRQQRRDALRWVDKMADTLDAIARDTPDWLPADDPGYGCTEQAGNAPGSDRDDA